MKHFDVFWSAKMSDPSQGIFDSMQPFTIETSLIFFRALFHVPTASSARLEPNYNFVWPFESHMDDSDILPDEDVTTWREVLEDYRPNQNDDDDEELETGGGQSSAGALSCH